MGAIAVKDAIEYWGYVAPMLVMPTNETEYEALVEALDEILDAGGANESSPLSILADRMGDLVAQYEARYVQEVQGTGADALRFLMEANGLTQASLPEIASQGVLSEILSGKRELNLRQVRKLAERFNVPVQVFV